MGMVFGEKTGSEQWAEDVCRLHPLIYVVGSCYVDLTLPTVYTTPSLPQHTREQGQAGFVKLL